MAANKAFELAIKIGGDVLPSLKRATKNAQKQISTLRQTVTRDLDGAFRKAEKSAARVADNRAWRTGAVVATAYTGAVGLALQEVVKWDAAMANVRKGLGDAGPAAMRKFSRDALRLSTEMPVPGEELLGIGSQFALAGEEVGDLIPLMRTAAQMSVAFDMSSTEAAGSMLALRASTGKSNEELVKLADAINHVSDNIKGKVSGGDLLSLTSQLAGIMNITSLTAEEFAGLGAAFLATGTPVELARTGLKNLLNAMQAGQGATKMQLEGIGMLFGGDAKAQADALAQRMVDDPKAAIADVIQRMSNLSAKEQPQALKMFVGEEGKAAIAPLLTNPELVPEAMGLVANPMEYQGSMLREYENQSKAASAQLKKLSGQLKAMGVVIGSTLLPPLTAMLTALGPSLQAFAEWGQKNQALVGTLTATGLALSGLILLAPGIAALGSLIGSLGAFMAGTGAMAALAGHLGAVGPALAAFKAGGMIAGLKALGAAFVAVTGPVGLTVLAIAGVGLALKALYDKVPAFQRLFDHLWASAKAVLGHAMEGIGGLLKAAGGVFRGLWALVTGDGEALRAAWGEILDGMGQWWKALQDGLDDVLPGLSSTMKGWLSVLFGLFTGDIGRMAEGWKQIEAGWEEIAPRLEQGVQNWLKRLGTMFAEQGREAGLKWAGEMMKNMTPLGVLSRAAGAISEATRAPQAPTGPLGPPAPSGGGWFDGMKPFKLGGAVNALRPILVGERGPEVFVPPASGRIVPHQDLLSLSQKLGLSMRALGGPVWRDQPVLTGERRAEVFMPSGVEDVMASRRQEMAAATGPSMVVNIGGIKIEGADTSNSAAIEAAVSEALRKAERRWANRAGQRTRLLLND